MLDEDGEHSEKHARTHAATHARSHAHAATHAHTESELKVHSNNTMASVEVSTVQVILMIVLFMKGL